MIVLKGPQLDLYLLALKEIQDTEQNDKVSWYQLAGKSRTTDQQTIAYTAL